MNSGAGPFLKPKVALWPGGKGGLSIFPAKAGFPKVALTKEPPSVWSIDLWPLIRYTTLAITQTAAEGGGLASDSFGQRATFGVRGTP